MRYHVIGVIDGRRMEMPVEASGVVDAIRTAEDAGMVVVDVVGVPETGVNLRSTSVPTPPDPAPQRIDGPMSGPPPMPTKRKGDSPLLCFGLGFLIPIVGVIVGLFKWKDDQAAAGAAIVGAIIGFLIWGSVISGL